MGFLALCGAGGELYLSEEAAFQLLEPGFVLPLFFIKIDGNDKNKAFSCCVLGFRPGVAPSSACCVPGSQEQLFLVCATQGPSPPRGACVSFLDIKSIRRSLGPQNVHVPECYF